jgi:hypothetical protein
VPSSLITGYVNVVVTDASFPSNPATLVNGFSYLVAGQLTLAQLTLGAQYKADMVNSSFISAAEWTFYINQSYYELYDILTQKYGEDYFVSTPYLFNSDGVNQQFYLPVNFYKILGVDMALNPTNTPDQWITLKRFNFAERNKWNWPIVQNFYGVTDVKYRIEGNTIFFVPLPQGGQTFRIWFIPRLVELVNANDIVDGVSGWTEYIMVDAAIKAKDKEESDCTILMAQKMALLDRIESAAENRDPGSPQTVSDTRRANGAYGSSNGSDWGWE